MNRMKQHITKEQLLELNSENLKKLYMLNSGAYVFRIAYHEEYYENEKIEDLDWGNAIGSINIGTMIEILGEKLKGINTPNSADKYSGVFLRGDGRVEFKEDCLCDALWEAVKYKIKREVKQSE